MMLFTPSKICEKSMTAVVMIDARTAVDDPPTKRARATRMLEESQKVELMLFATSPQKETQKIVKGRRTAVAHMLPYLPIHAQCFFSNLLFIIIVRCGFISEHIDERRNRFQPQVPLQLPCYDLIPVTNIIFT